MATSDRVFDMFTNQAHALRRGGPRRPGGTLMLFAGARRAATLMRETDEVIVERFLAGVHQLYPQTRGMIAGATVHRWRLGNVYARLGRSRLQTALEGPLGAHENLHLAGDYFAELGNIEDAAAPTRGRRTRRHPNPRGNPCLSPSMECCPRSSRPLPTTAARSTPTRSPRSSTA